MHSLAQPSRSTPNKSNCLIVGVHSELERNATLSAVAAWKGKMSVGSGARNFECLANLSNAHTITLAALVFPAKALLLQARSRGFGAQTRGRGVGAMRLTERVHAGDRCNAVPARCQAIRMNSGPSGLDHPSDQA